MSRRPRSRSLRTRLLTLVTVTLACVCATLALTTVLAQRASLTGSLDERLDSAAERSVDGAALHPEHPADLAFLHRGGHPEGLLAARLDAAGHIVSAAVVTQDAAPRTLSSAQRTALTGIPADGSVHTRTVPGLGTYRLTALDASGIRVLTGLPMDDLLDTLGRLAETEAVVSAAGLAVAVGACAVVIRRRLRPLGRVAATAADVSRAPLGRGRAAGLPRVPERDTDPGSESGQVGAALNLMIDHVEASLAERRRGEERMRRFLADASHELRTPLASIAGYAELMNRIAPDAAWRRVGAESARMTALVEDLLLLARLDEGRPPQSVEVDLVGVVAEAVRQVRVTAPGHRWQLRLRPDAPAPVTGDDTRLRRLVAGLLANARMHTPPGTTVTVTVESGATHHVVLVQDDGPGIPPALLPTVFDCFTRADASRSRAPGAAGGAGLGLAIAAGITAAHGGRIRADSAPGRTEFTVELPAAAPSWNRTPATPPPAPPAPQSGRQPVRSGKATSAQITLP
ncbi:sensor histidine kinase [Streptomyces cellostaticus]|uniref:sensor histidine kinase n=1 Tax=Streptomyces cellostaticus TaxID=67285 RepID=UPI00082DF269|nr:HAMP domain-containing sensor histidine kinase [Streptomyces cellostaticus]GHI02347.1 sensor histidine kinase [Streptomyces cellostaticus]